MQTNNSHFTPAWRAFFAFSIVAAILQVAFALALLLQDTSEAGSRLFLGFSPARLLIIGVLSGVLVFFVWLLIRSWTNPAWTERQFYKLCNLPQHPKTYTSLLLIFGLLALGGLYTITLTPELSEPFTAAVFNRLLPFTILVTGLSAQALLILILARFGSNHKDLWKDNAIFWLALVIFSLFFVLWGWVSRTTLPSESAITGWNDLGVPILEMQVFLAWLAGIVTWGLTLLGRQNAQTSVHNRWLPKFSPKIFDLGIFLILWIGTILLWNSTPSVPSWFLSTPRPPNYELYPNSDALAYDMSAQSLLNGEGILFANEIYVRRPALALFFAILHSLGGQSASMVIFWQIVFLAVTPAFVYLTGKALHSRPAGVITGVLVALRGANAIALAGSITTSHVKILMADLPATFVMVLFLYLAIRWLQTFSKNLALISGGLLGLAVLIRPELVSAILAVGLISILVYRRQLRQWMVSFILFSLGISLVLAPWIYRNWSLTGLIFLDTPSFRTDWLQERYNVEPPAPTPTSDSTDQSQRSIFTIRSPLYSTSQSAIHHASRRAALQPTAQVPTPTANIARFVSSHYLHSQIQLFLILPTTFRPLDSLVALMAHRSPEQFRDECCSALNYIRRLPYWHKWSGEIPLQAAVLLALNLVLIGLGIQRSWKRNRWLGFLPLAVVFFHLLVNALARNSGGRYIMTIDWIMLLYFSFGLTEASVWVVNLFTKEKLPVEAEVGLVSVPAASKKLDKPLLRSPQFYLLVIFLLIVGSLAPILEKAIQPRYTEQRQAKMLALLLESSGLAAEQKQSLERLLIENADIRIGRALYPRFYRAGQGEPDSLDPLGAQDYSRLGFYLTRGVYQPIVLPLANKPEVFPNGSDALVISCPDGQVVAVALFESPDGPLMSAFFRSGELIPSSCINPG